MTYIKRFLKEPEKSYFLLGPRGTGKSTYLINQHKNNSIWIDLLDPELFRKYFAYPEDLFDLIPAKQSQSTVIIDEIQRAPKLLTVVHSLIEKKRGIKFILIGSSARKLKRTQADLLGGRALKCLMHPFMAAELGRLFSLEKNLQVGLLPIVFNEKNPQAVLNAYIDLYLHEEIQMEGLVRNLDDFSRFLEIISFSHGETINTANIARECAVKRKTVENYLQILEDLLLARRLPVFTKRAKRALSAHPKFYLFDSGIYQTLRPRGVLDHTDEIDGAAMEGLIAQHLFAWCDYTTEKKHTVSFWRTRSGLEVDFVVYGPKGLWAIEVKNSSKIHPQDTHSLNAFLEDYPQASGLLLYRGKDYLRKKNILCIPSEDFLLQLIPDQAIWK